MRKLLYVIGFLLLFGLSTPAADAQEPVRDFVLLGKVEKLPANLDELAAAAGGAVAYTVPEIGMAVLTSANPDFQAQMEAHVEVESVSPDVQVHYEMPEVMPQTMPHWSGSLFDFANYQWNLDAVDAPEAWATGARGDGVRIAIVDDGLVPFHPDLYLNLNHALSKSFDPFDANPFASPGHPSHSSHVAGVAAAMDNNLGIIGVAPEAEIVGVRVLRWIPDAGATIGYRSEGKFSWLAAGIVYAADIESDVINISLAGWLDKNGFCSGGECYTKKEAGELKKLLDRATRYAHKQGAVVIAAAGNNGLDTDQNGQRYVLPAESDKVIAVSATGPVNWISHPNTDLDQFAPYSNYGKKLVAFAAPGGNPTLAVTDPGCVAPFPLFGVLPCHLFDNIWGPSSSTLFPWTLAAGTSAAAPHVSGVAALIIGQNGGDMQPEQVIQALKKGADDLGAKGKDPYFGDGRVNAAASLEWLAGKTKMKDVGEVDMAGVVCAETGSDCTSAGTYRVFLGLVGNR